MTMLLSLLKTTGIEEKMIYNLSPFIVRVCISVNGENSKGHLEYVVLIFII